MQTTTETLNRTLQKKLHNLVSFLSQVAYGFNTVAEEIDNSGLRSAIQAVATESKQFISEINNQFECFNVGIVADQNDHLWKQMELNVNDQAMLEKGGEIVALCNNCEVFFNKLYAEVLQEDLPAKNCKDIISYQLYAINCALMKIKLLNATRFNQQFI